MTAVAFLSSGCLLWQKSTPCRTQTRANYGSAVSVVYQHDVCLSKNANAQHFLAKRASVYDLVLSSYVFQLATFSKVVILIYANTTEISNPSSYVSHSYVLGLSPIDNNLPII